jgi:F420-non-reducing hydrogenase small subunit
MSEKLKFAFYWAGSCGGCEVSVLDINEKILDVVGAADILFWPVALDFKYHHVEAMPDGHIDVTFFNGAIRNAEHREIAELLRRKSKVLVAFGACSNFGGIPGLGNTKELRDIYATCYHTISTSNSEGILPKESFKAPEGVLTLPEVFPRVYSLNQVVKVDYFLPGCPPPPSLIATAVNAIVTGALPPPGSVIAGSKSVCDECTLEKSENKQLKHFKRYHEVEPDGKRCLMEQGIICCGPATRSGCEAQCIKSNIPCRGCFGPAQDVLDQGGKMVSFIASLVDTQDEAEAKRILDEVLDPLGTFYRFTMAESLLQKCASN